MAKDFKVTPEGWAQIELRAAKSVGRIVKDVASDARRICPEDTGELLDSITEHHQEGALEGSVKVGTDHWAPTEFGSGPHQIQSHGNYPLRNAETGEVFGRSVNHPGTPEQPFMRPALYQRRVYNDIK